MATPTPALTLRGISSMATKALLAELAAAYEAASGVRLQIESVGGVDAARRVAAGEAFDVVLLASDAIDKLAAAGAVPAGSRVDYARSPVAVAVRAGVPAPDIGTEAALKAAVRAAPSLAYSTGPSGVFLAQLFERWGIAQEVAARTVQAPPGVPVGSLVARGDAALGFQQLSELMALPGIQLLGVLPAEVACITTFSAAPCRTTTQPGAVRELLAWLASPATTDTKRRHGMDAA